MKHKKSLLTVILVVILLASAVSGTIAYLMASTGTVENTFTPTQVDTEVAETVSGDAKTFIGVENPQNDKSIPAFVRVAITGNWCDEDGNIVKEWHPGFTHNSTDWDKSTVNGQDYYYYKHVLAVGDTTENLLADGVSISSTAGAPEGCHLVVIVMQQAIQAEGMGATGAVDAWQKAKG